MTIQVTPATPIAGVQFAVTTNVANVIDPEIDLYMLAGATCAVDPYDEGFTNLVAWDFTDSLVYQPTLAAGTYAFTAAVWDDDGFVTSDCVEVTVGVTPTPAVPSDTISSSYLCWNRWMDSPVAYVDKTADTMWKTGNYFEPQAILGNVEGGTNIGAYHLVCNAPSTMHQTDVGLGGSGEVYSAEMMAAYHAEHAGGNDLNVYHIGSSGWTSGGRPRAPSRNPTFLRMRSGVVSSIFKS